MNSAPISLRLLLGVGDAGQLRQEAILGVDGDQRHLEVVAEGGDDLLALVLAHQPVVDEHAGQPVADRPVHEQRRDARVDAAGEPADRPPVADLLRGSARSAPRSPSAALQVRRSRRCRSGSSSAPAGRTACGRPRGGTGSRRCRARPTRTRRPATRSRTRARRTRAAARTRCRGATSSTSARPACRRAAGPARGRSAASGRTRRPRRPRLARRARARAAACRSRCRAPGCPSSSSSGSSCGAPSA